MKQLLNDSMEQRVGKIVIVFLFSRFFLYIHYALTVKFRNYTNTNKYSLAVL
jgi:hypothetical protein